MNSEVRTKPEADIRPAADTWTGAEARPSFAGTNDKSLPALFTDLAREIVELIRKEAALARAEVSEKFSSAQSGVASLAAGGALAMAGLIVVLIAMANALAMVLPLELAPWLAPLIVGGVALLVGYMMVKRGQSRLKPENLVPDRTVNSLRTDRDVVQEKTR